MFKRKLFFHNADTGTGSAGGQATSSQTQPASTPEIDYDKIASVVEGKQKVAEDTVLKNYFKQQGLSGEEMAQAITAFKSQKADATPDVAQASALQANLERNLQLAAIEEGLPVGVLPYVMKLADTSTLTLESKPEDFKAIVAKVLEDVPALKPNKEESTGFQQIGSTGKAQQTSQTDAIAAAFGL